MNAPNDTADDNADDNAPNDNAAHDNAAHDNAAHDNAAHDAGVVTISILGPLLVCRDRVPIDIAPAKVRMLLGLLALDPNRAVPRDEIVDTLWEGEPPATYGSLIHVYVSRLRAQLRRGLPAGADEALVTKSNSGGYRLRVDPSAVDLVHFDQLVQRARQAVDSADHPAAIDAYEAALGLWRGMVLEGLDPRFEQLPVVVSAYERRVSAAVELAQLYHRSGRHQLAVETLRPLTGTAPHHECLQARLIQALAASGDRGAALAAYEAIRRRLAEDYGVDPGTELQEIHLELLRGGPQPERASQPPVDTPGGSTRAQPPAGTPVTSSARPQPTPWRQRRPAVLAGCCAAVLLATAGGAYLTHRHGTAPGPSASESRLASMPTPTSFVANKQGHWSYGPSLGVTPEGTQWASAYVSGLGTDDGVAGFRLRVGANPEGTGSEQGILLGVCTNKYEIEGEPADMQQGFTALPSEGVLKVAISLGNLATITFGDALVTQVQLHGNYNGGLNIVPAIWNDKAHVAMTEIRSNIPPRPTGNGSRPARRAAPS